MKSIQLRPYQSKAIESIKTAIKQGKKYLAVEMAAGSGKGMVFAKTIEFLQKTKSQEILVVVDHLVIKEQILSKIITNYRGCRKGSQQDRSSYKKIIQLHRR